MKKLKKPLAFLMALAMVVTVFVSANFTASAEVQGYYTYEVKDGKATIISCDTNVSGDISIPSQLGGYSLSLIGQNAFKDCKNITGVLIPNSVEAIGSGAFQNCTDITAVTVGNKVVSIADSAFDGCIKLESISLGNSVASIGNSAFADCISLPTITLPKTLNSIGDSAFLRCTALSSVKISDLTAWCEITFSNSDSNPLTYAHDLYLNNTKLTKITVPETVNLIGNYQFSGFQELAAITIGENVTSIGKSAFADCFKLETVKIPNSVTQIGESAFAGCSWLKSVTFGSAVKSVGQGAFADCTLLNKVNFIGDATHWCKIAFSDYKANPLSYAASLYFNNKLVTSLVLSDSTTAIADYALCNCESLESVIIPVGVVSIGDYAFANCQSLESVYYGGTSKQWKTVSCDYYANDSLAVAKIYYNSTGPKYSITYVLNGGSNSEENPSDYTVKDEVTFKNPTRKGYSFKGWYTSSAYTKKVSGISAGATGDKTFYAKWGKKTYEVTYKLNGGKNNSKNIKKYTVTTSTFKLKDPTRKGYTFKGWYSNKKLTKKVTKIAKGSTGNKTLYAKWSKNTYKVTYKLNGGKNNSKNIKKYTVTTSTFKLKNPTRKGYTFKGWYSNKKLTKKVTKIAKGSTGNKTFYAKWKKK